MIQDLEHILSQLSQPDNAVIQQVTSRRGVVLGWARGRWRNLHNSRQARFVLSQATVQLKQAFKDPAIIPALCAVVSNCPDPQVLLSNPAG